MNNPFIGKPNAVIWKEDLIGKEDNLGEMEDMITYNRHNVVIQGLCGTGKTSLMNVFFNSEYCVRMAREKTLFCYVTFPLLDDVDMIYHLLANAVVQSLDILDRCGLVELFKLEKLRKACDRIRETSINGAARYQDTVKKISQIGGENYRLVFILDDAHHITTSPQITRAHLDILRQIVRQPGVNVQYVLATDYDLNESSVQEEAQGSLWVQDFSGNLIVVRGLSLEECGEYVNGLTLGTGVEFQESELKAMRDMTAGNPTLLRIAARRAFDMKAILEETLGEDEWEEIADQVYEEAKPLLKMWCSPLPDQQVELVRMLAETPDSKVEKNMSSHVAALENRDLLVKSVRIKGGMSMEWPGHYRLCCKLLERFCLDPGMLEEAVASCPLRQDKKKPAVPAVGVAAPIPNAEEPRPISFLLREALNQLSSEMDDDTREQIVEQIHGICKVMDLPMPHSAKEILRDDVLYEYALSLEVLNQYNEKTRAFIVNGIMTDMTMRNVKMEMDDRASSYVNFAKAIEAHMNDTLLPVLKWAIPNQVVKKDQKMKNVSTLMLGEMAHVLNLGNNNYSANKLVADLGKACANLPGKFSESWWKKVAEQVDKIKDLRNLVPHRESITCTEGTKMLQVAFRGEKCFMKACTDVYEAAKSKGVL